jgi:23S rRNA (cytidine1920-2'-O)/16S rRNA (cytidine1409-2'-O)-methyltransferase
MEKTNLKSLVPNMFVNKIDLIVSDVSFISLKHVFNVSQNLLKKNKIMIVLIKPEFEASSNLVEKGGYVQEKHHKLIIEDIIKYAKTKMFKNIGIIKSPILGKKSKNKEYLGIFKCF